MRLFAFKSKQHSSLSGRPDRRLRFATDRRVEWTQTDQPDIALQFCLLIAQGARLSRSESQNPTPNADWGYGRSEKLLLGQKRARHGWPRQLTVLGVLLWESRRRRG